MNYEVNMTGGVYDRYANTALWFHMRSLGSEPKKKDLSHSDKSTNRGLISEDRSTEATLLFTIPRSCLSRLHRIYL